MSAQREPSPPPPTIIPAERVTRLGELRGKVWIEYRGIEYALDPRPLRDADPLVRLSDAQTYIADEASGELLYRHASPRPAGSFAAGGRLPVPAKARKSKPPRRIDALDAVPLLARRPESWVSLPLRGEDRAPALDELAAVRLSDMPEGIARRLAEPPPAITGHTPARPPARGGAAIIERLGKVGIAAALTPDREHVTYSAPAGGCPAPLLPVLDLVAPLVRAYLTGEPLLCAFCGSDAETILAGGAPCCAEHASEQLAPPSPPTLRERVGRALRR